MYLQLDGVLVTSPFTVRIPEAQPLEIVQATDLSIDGYMFDNTGAEYNIAGSTITLAVKKHATDDGYGIIISNATLTDATHGKFNFAISHTATNLSPGAYVYQVLFVSTDSKRDYPVPQSLFNVLPALDE